MIPKNLSGLRLDRALAQLFPQYSRSQFQTWIRAGNATVDGNVQNKIREIVKENQIIDITAPIVPDERWLPQEIPLDIIYEDNAIIVINKPAGLVVHPGAGTPDHTLVNALLYHDPQLASVPRAGVIHRLDKNTTGLMVIARTLEVHHFLVKQMKLRHIQREYEAVVNGVMIAGGTVNEKIGRHPTQRIKMAVVDSGREAVTHYRVLERYRAHTYIHVQLETGRTHQIRVHLTHIHYPIVGDTTYGRHTAPPAKASHELKATLQAFHRQALHACRLALLHPKTHERMEWSAPLPSDMAHLLEVLREDAGDHQ